jgi:AcrR family transcriptional regulator
MPAGRPTSRVDEASGRRDIPRVDELQNPNRSQQQRILEAARTLFLSQGYNGSNLRDIAREAKVSMGGIYHHFASKEEIYKSLLQQSDVAQDMFQILRLFQAPEFPENLAAVAEAIARTVRKHKDSFKLFYIDVLEFQGKNVKPLIQQFRDKFNDLSEMLLNRRSKDLSNVHPAILMRTMIDVFVHTRLEEVMLEQSLAERLGLTEEEVTRQMAEVVLRGALKRG